ncbi:UNVERIFIED_CONTAM: hypothetical protein PYX00_000665 [Menopon gallinae]|uniref:Uncharacterized protein n=1 Tax=Menopon gallinae TaxID=328185 RepID=A0AAW2IA38_9NEOP
MWSPATWYYPQGIAAAEAWAEYLKNAQQATNQLYQQFDQTGASGLFNPGQSAGQPSTSPASQAAQSAADTVSGAAQQAASAVDKAASGSPA